MSLQDTILKRYRENFPEDTLREISDKTGIQLTRVFRIFNGSDMKLREFEAFENAITCESNQFATTDFLELSQKSLKTLSDKKIAYIMGQMQQAIRISQMKNHNIIYLNRQQLA